MKPLTAGHLPWLGRLYTSSIATRDIEICEAPKVTMTKADGAALTDLQNRLQTELLDSLSHRFWLGQAIAIRFREVVNTETDAVTWPPVHVVD